MTTDAAHQSKQLTRPDPTNLLLDRKVGRAPVADVISIRPRKKKNEQKKRGQFMLLVRPLFLPLTSSTSKRGDVALISGKWKNDVGRPRQQSI